MAERTKVGIVGCGSISGIYFKAGETYKNDIEIVACADLVHERAKEKAREHGVPKACTTEKLLNDPDVEIVVNLTVPKAHSEVGLAALKAGKSTYGEKPLTVTREDGKEMLKIATEKGLRVGAAPDTFMGSGGQTCRKLIEEGAIGEPVGATAFMLCHGHESWHPSPEFYYEKGGGPMFDMGPYYLTALVNLLGPVKRVTGATKISFPTRTITSEAKYGKVIEVETATHIAGTMDFANGAVGTITTSFDVWAAKHPPIEIYGTEGTIAVPDPNGFGGSVMLWRRGAGDWLDVPWTHAENHRGFGLADMAAGIRSGRPHRASGELAYHVLDLMHAFHDASDQGKHIEMQSTCAQPELLPVYLKQGEVPV